MSNINEELKAKWKPQYTLKVNERDASRRSGTKTESPYRTEFSRDRDRVLYCKAFRRLAGKAQVYISGVDDHKRTRLTHTLEVSQIARSIAEPLKLDLDLVEAIALGHDLGHTPYGHAGERTLHEIMTPQKNHTLGPECPLNLTDDSTDIPESFRSFLGFKHNLQSLVVIMDLEKNHDEWGLDLTNYAMYGIQAHSGGKHSAKRVSNHDSLGYYDSYLKNGCMLENGRWAWSLESLLVAEADEIAQHHHDVEDALLGGLISREEIVKIITDCFGDFDPFQKLSNAEKEMLKNPASCDMGKFMSLISRVIINMLVTRLTVTAAYHLNLICSTKKVLINGKEENITNATFREYRLQHDPTDEDVSMIFSYSYTKEEKEDKKGFAKRIEDFHDIITQRVLSSYDIQKADAKGIYIIKKLFQAYYATPQQLPNHCVYEFLSEYDPKEYPQHKLLEMARSHGTGMVRQIFSGKFKTRDRKDAVKELILMRVICNHIAGMTDTYAQKIYEELYG